MLGQLRGMHFMRWRRDRYRTHRSCGVVQLGAGSVLEWNVIFTVKMLPDRSLNGGRKSLSTFPALWLINVALLTFPHLHLSHRRLCHIFLLHRAVEDR